MIRINNQKQYGQGLTSCVLREGAEIKIIKSNKKLYSRIDVSFYSLKIEDNLENLKSHCTKQRTEQSVVVHHHAVLLNDDIFNRIAFLNNHNVYSHIMRDFENSFWIKTLHYNVCKTFAEIGRTMYYNSIQKEGILTNVNGKMIKTHFYPQTKSTIDREFLFNMLTKSNDWKELTQALEITIKSDSEKYKRASIKWLQQHIETAFTKVEIDVE